MIKFNLTKFIKYGVFACANLLFLYLIYILYDVCSNRPFLFVYRTGLVCIAYTFVMLHLFCDIKKLYDFIFRYRIAIGVGVFLLLVISKINFSSIGMWNTYIQPGSGSDFNTPVFGSPKPIRSDEWAIGTPKLFTYQYFAGEKINDIIMASPHSNLSASGLQFSLSMLAKPFNIGYYFLGPEYGLSIFWCGMLVFELLMYFEFFLVFSNQKKLLSLMGSFLVTFSSFNLWWSFASAITYGASAVLFIYYFFSSSSIIKRVLFAFLVAVFGAAFVGNLYPAWLVPLGYLYLGIIIWCLIKNYEKIKKLRWFDWLICVVGVFFAFCIIFACLYNQRDYTEAITNTVYPGEREDTGWYSLYKLFLYPVSLKFPFDHTSINTSENGTFFSFFPLPIILSVFSLIKTKKIDFLSIWLIILSIYYTIYCTIGLPYVVAKYTLLTYSTAWRVADILGYIQIILLIRSISTMREFDIFIPKWLAILVSAIIGLLTLKICYKYFSNYVGIQYLVIVIAFIIAVMFVCMAVRNKKVFISVSVVLSAVIVACGIYVLPIQRGIDVIYEKPAAIETQKIVKNDPDASWIAVDQWVEANFYAACGAKVINSNNYVPNMEMWLKLFPDGEYEDIYNRYSNMIISLTSEQSVPELIQADLIKLNLNFSELEKLDVKYIASKHEVIIPDEYTDISIECIYVENGIYIYSLNYI